MISHCKSSILESCSLELIKDEFTDGILTRSIALQLYGLDYPCRKLTASGVFTPELNRTARYLKDTLPLEENHYNDFSDAIKSTIAVNHGSEGYGTQFIILAPIDIRIIGIHLINERLRIGLNCYPEAELDVIKLVIFNRDNESDSKVMNEFIKIDESNTYSQTTCCEYYRLSLKLYHNSDLIEERFYQ